MTMLPLPSMFGRNNTSNSKPQVLPHPPYKLDLAPCDFHALGPLRGLWFGGAAVHTWTREQPETCCSEGIMKNVD